ncbi:helix-loop-helix DNA-binding domain-containing protein [Purpureocillium lavendulum]|uniref:Helix-loop-helix DNA-binding domain-containing protein n=1 Tax=Purpureocillium lavendulum TaxID=1247861 RepID=A0AB34FUP0_9HYPO|nr:helix-loop-helix DNA-binding domain-containing protein [Purpureocillium lavendulum]
MSSPNNTSTSPGDGAGATQNPDEKPRLTEEEKKQNHIASEDDGDEDEDGDEVETHMRARCLRLFLALFFFSRQQKRRQAIREGFDRLTELVPGLEGQGRSEGLVLKRTVEFMRQQIEERRVMVDQIERAGGRVDDELKK